jgi:hypothetical protein
MDSVTIRNTPQSHQAMQATGMLPVETGHGVLLIATCLLNARTSQMSVAEIYEWLAQKYPSYQYTKSKIRHVLRRDSARLIPRFGIANKHRIAGVPLRWTIRPGMEPELRRCLSGPLPTAPSVPQFYGGLSQQEVHSSNKSVSPAVHEKMESCFSTSAVSSKPGMRSKRVASGVLPADRLLGKRQRTCRCIIDHQLSGDELPVQGSTNKAADTSEEAVQGPDMAIRENFALQQRLRDCFKRESNIDSSKNYKLYTKASIVSTRGIVELGRVQIDKSSLHNLLPRSIASKLGLLLHFGSIVKLRVADRTVTTNQYCRFNINVANIKTTIDAYVVTELSSLLLGWEWTQQVNLLSDLGNYTFYIPGPNVNLKKLPDPAPVVRDEAETEFATEPVVTKERMSTVDKVPTASKNYKGRCNKECEVNESTSADESAMGEKTRRGIQCIQGPTLIRLLPTA